MKEERTVTGDAVVAPAAPAAPRWLDRERAILAFNRRVLAQAERADVPPLERLRYITIVSSNLDEFFEVRFADLAQAARQPGAADAVATMEAVAGEAHRLVDEQYAAFDARVMPALREHGIRLLSHHERDAAQRRWVAEFFAEQVQPLLVPVGLDPSHPFPTVANKSLNFIVRLTGRDAFGRQNQIAIVKVPRVLPRVIRLPDALAPRGEQCFVLLHSVIRAHLDALFPGRAVEAFSQFRVTRDSDLEVADDDVTNLRQALRSGLTTRHFGQAVRLEVVSTCPAELAQFLLGQFGLPESALYRVNGPVNLVRLAQLIDQARGDALRFAPHEPAWPATLARGKPLFERLREGDVLLHHPFESFEPVVALLREAVHDPDVLAIKQTVYRTGSQSVLMDLLIEGARRGKEVMAVVELKARFDEEANIDWADRLAAVGAQVVYGVVGLKTHAKMLLVTRREGGAARGKVREPATQLRRYLHLSTGNYNPRTARAYTDLGLLTADADMTRDADAVFSQLAGLSRMPEPRVLLPAPFHLHAAMLREIGRVADAARAGAPARIVIKLNALTEPALMQALAAASQAGAEIDLIVRGACMLAPGVAGHTERIRVRSIVGRFLEHTRIAYFRFGPKSGDESLFLSSADWMGRNMFGRIELAWPVRDAALRQRIIDEALVPYLRDERDAWRQGSDGGYTRVAEAGISAQQALIDRLRGAQPAKDDRWT